MAPKSKYFALEGGLNLEGPALSMKSGELIGCQNYECDIQKGYRRIDGYERSSGYPLASVGTYHTLNFDSGEHEPTLGELLVESISGAEGNYITSVVSSGAWATSDAAGYLVIYVTSGEFEDAENVSVGGTLICVATDDQVSRGATTDTLDQTYLQATMEYLRGLVAAVPGSGPIRGVWHYSGVDYAFRDDATATTCKMYKSTAAGWVEVVTGLSLSPGGRYEFANFNFTGHSGTRKMYGVDGVNKGFQFDGTTFTQITSAMATDTPKHLAAYKKHLFYSFVGGSVQHSAIGDPTVLWVPLLGAGEIRTGDEITGFVTSPGQALFILCRNSAHVLKGSSATDWEFQAVSDVAGAIEYTIQRFNYPLYLDDPGVSSLESVDQYGDFYISEITQKIKKLLKGLKGTITGSIKVREKSQYRLFFEDKSILTFTLAGKKLIGVGVSRFDVNVRVPVSVEDSTGAERLLFGDDDGYVYRMDSGYNFDGEEVEGWIRPIFNHFGSPGYQKTFFKTVLEIDADQSTEITFLPAFDYDSADSPAATDETDVEVLGGGGWWDSPDTVWEDFYFDAQTVGSAFGYTEGVGTNFSLFIRSTGTYVRPHTIQGAIIHYSQKGIKR